MLRSHTNTRIYSIFLAILLISAPALLIAGASVSRANAASVVNISQSSSGLVTSDPLTTGDMSLWTLGGSVNVFGGTSRAFENQAGLHLGVQSATNGQWAGYYAAKGESAQLFHATLSLPSATISDPQNFNTGLYVQTGGSNVDYVTCAGGVNNQGYFWAVVQATGNTNGATNFNTLWFQWMGGQPLTRDCTIVTNGSNLLKVYLDGTLVFSSTSMNLGYQYPLTVFLEVQTTDGSKMFFSTYTDYYATKSDTVTVKGLVPYSTAQIVGTSGSVLSTAQADGSGTAHLDIGMYDMPLAANIEDIVLGAPVASTSGPVNIFGGDVYTTALGSGTSQGTPSGPFTTKPSVAGVINVNVGDGITLGVGGTSVSTGSSSGSVCILGLCL